MNTPKENENIHHYELYLKTEYEIASNRLKEAEEISKILIESKPPLPAHIARARLLFESGKFFELIQSPFFSEIEKTKDWENIIMSARTYETIGMDDKAQNLFHKAMEKYPDKDQVVYYSVMHEIKKGNTKNAEEMIDKFLNSSPPKGRHSIFYQLKAAINLQKDNANITNLQEALETINKSLQLNPRSEKALRMKILILEQLKQLGITIDQKDLITTYKQTCTLTEDNTLKKILIDKLFKAGYCKDAYQELSSIKDTTPEHLFDLALLSYKLGKLELALSHTEQALKLNKNFLKALMLKLEILSKLKPEQAIAFGLEWFKNEKQRSISRGGLLYLAKQGIGKTEVLKTLKEEFLANKENTEALAGYADALLISGYYQQAAKAYARLEDLLTSNTYNASLKSKLVYSHCVALYMAGHKEQSMHKLENSIELGKILPEIYNLLAILKIHAKKYTAAVKLANKAVKANPVNPCFLDTLQLALFNVGKFIQSLKVNFLLRTLDPFGKSRHVELFLFPFRPFF